MSLIKRIDVKQHFAARRGTSLVASRPVSQPDASELLEIDGSGTRANASDSVEDLSLEQCSSRVIVTPIGIAADSGGTQAPAAAGGPPA